MDNRLLARLAREGGGRLLDLAVGRFLPDPVVEPETRPKKRSLAGKLANAALLRIAAKSVPGAIIVTGGLLATRAHERRKAKRTKAKGDSGTPAP